VVYDIVQRDYAPLHTCQLDYYFAPLFTPELLSVARELHSPFVFMPIIIVPGAGSFPVTIMPGSFPIIMPSTPLPEAKEQKEATGARTREWMSIWGRKGSTGERVSG